MRKKKQKYENNIVVALSKLCFPIYDKRHNLIIHLEVNKARSNQTRLEHIAKSYHKLTPKDIESIPEGINCARLKKDPARKDTFNYYYVRKGDYRHYIKISVIFANIHSRDVFIKTIFVTKTIK